MREKKREDEVQDGYEGEERREEEEDDDGGGVVR